VASLAHIHMGADQVVGMVQHSVTCCVTARGAVSAILRPTRNHHRRAHKIMRHRLGCHLQERGAGGWCVLACPLHTSHARNPCNRQASVGLDCRLLGMAPVCLALTFPRCGSTPGRTAGGQG